MQANRNDIFQALRSHINQFSEIEDADWEMLLPHIETKSLRKNELFIKEGKRAVEIGFVSGGMLRQYYSKDGEEKTTYFFFEHNLFASYISCITGKPSLVTIQALTDCTYLSFPYKVLLDLFERSMAWQRFGRLIAEYLGIGLEERMVSLLLESPEERYIGLLRSGKDKILERIPQHYIANYLGITAVSMSRIRHRIKKK